MSKKRLLCISMILSYIILSFILIYFNLIDPNYEGSLGLILSIVVILLWLVSVILFGVETKKNVFYKKNTLDDVLTVIALIPLIVILVIPFLILWLVLYIIDLIKNNIKIKCKILIEKGFALSKEKINGKQFYFLTKDNIVIRFHEFDLYEISLDNQTTFVDISELNLISHEDRMEIDNLIYKYKSCDYRDKDMYEPKDKIILIISKYF